MADPKDIKKQIRKQTVGYLVAALGLVAGLAWNDAIKDVIEKFFPMKTDTIYAKLFYAVLLTFIIATVSTYLLNWAEKDRGDSGENK
jgi:hypothetical protein